MQVIHHKVEWKEVSFNVSDVTCLWDQYNPLMETSLVELCKNNSYTYLMKPLEIDSRLCPSERYGENGLHKRLRYSMISGLKHTDR